MRGGGGAGSRGRDVAAEAVGGDDGIGRADGFRSADRDGGSAACSISVGRGVRSARGDEIGEQFT